MNLNTFREDLVRRMETDKKRSLRSVAQQYGVEQASLYRFVKRNKGLSGAYVCALWPYVYGYAMNHSAPRPHDSSS